MKAQDAADTTAQFHGDYASVPPKTRRKLNKLFFTPTFKIVMAKVYARMIKNALMAPINIARGKATRMQMQLALGAASTVAINLAFDALMRNYRLEPDEDEWWNVGRRYTRKINTRFGPKEFVLTWTNPANMFQRYIQKFVRAKKSAKQRGVFRAATDFLKWDLHPYWSTMMSLYENRKPNGEEISDFIWGAKQLQFTFSNLFKMATLVERDDPLTQREAKKHMNKMWGQIGKLLIDGPIAIMSAHTRTIKERHEKDEEAIS
jgi:hypothetical protein